MSETPETPEVAEPPPVVEPYVPGPNEVLTGESDPSTGEPVYETPEPPPAQTESDYFKISRAVDGDDRWKSRVKLALEISGKDIIGNEPPRGDLIKITKAVVANISCTVDGTIDTTGVTDEAIDAAIATLGAA